MTLSRFSIIGILMSVLLAALAIVPALAATATIDTDEDFVAPGGTIEVTVEDSDRDQPSASLTTRATFPGDGSTGQTIRFQITTLSALGDDDDESIFTDLPTTPTASPAADFFVSNVLTGDGFGFVDVTHKSSVAIGTDKIIDIIYKESSRNYVNVTVTSISNKTGISMSAVEDETNSASFVGTFTVSLTTSTPVNTIKAAPGETITIKYDDLDSDGEKTGTRSTTVKVESTDPTGSLISPATDSFTTDLSPTLVVNFTDADSGVDADTFQFTIIGALGDGASVTGDITGSALADVDTSSVTDGFQGEVTLGGIVDGDTTVIVWAASATDDAGNTGVTDSDSSKSGKQNFVLIVDKEGPAFSTATAFAGAWWDADDEVVSTDADDAVTTSIGIKLPDIYPEFFAGVAIDAGNEQLDGGTIATTDFEIDDLKGISGVTLSDVTPLAVNVYDDAKNWIFLTVPEMAPDAAPTIILKSGISDAAGNTTSTGEVDADDAIAPTITVTLGSTLDDDEVKLTITSDETLSTNPTVEANDGGGGSDIPPFSATLTATNEWEATIDPAGDGVFAVKVVGSDTAQNQVTVGNDLDTTDFPTSKSKVFFIDSNLDAAVVTPADGGSEEIAVPFFITLDFSAEKKEYGLGVDGTSMVTAAASTVDDDLDTHHDVTITAITLDDVDISAQLDTQDDVVFNLALLDMTVGEHELIYTAEDEAGNEVEDISIEFEVDKKSAYEIAMSAGWNLISFPGEPEDTAIDSVLDADHPATDVLSFTDGQWLVASRTGGAWEGTLTTITGTRAYWVNTTSSAPIEALLALPSVGAAATPPSVSVRAGWNMVPVIDLAQADQDSTAGSADDRDASIYFASIDWGVAYTYAASTRAWSRTTGMAGEELSNGQGVWVWAEGAGTLVP